MFYTVSEREQEAQKLIHNGFTTAMAQYERPGGYSDVENLRGSTKRLTDILKTVIQFYAPVKASEVITDPVRSSMLHLMKNRAFEVVDALMAGYRAAASRIEREAKKQKPDSDIMAENAYQSYAVRMWPAYKERFAVESPYLVILGITDRKDIRLLREMYRDYYISKMRAGGNYNQGATEREVNNFLMKLDEIEINLMVDDKQPGGAILKELHFGMQMLELAESNVKQALNTIAGTFKTGGQYPIPQWEPDETGNPVVEMVEALFSKYNDVNDPWTQDYGRFA